MASVTSKPPSKPVQALAGCKISDWQSSLRINYSIKCLTRQEIRVLFLKQKFFRQCYFKIHCKIPEIPCRDRLQLVRTHREHLGQDFCRHLQVPIQSSPCILCSALAASFCQIADQGLKKDTSHSKKCPFCRCLSD